MLYLPPSASKAFNATALLVTVLYIDQQFKLFRMSSVTIWEYKRFVNKTHLNLFLKARYVEE